MLSVKAPLHTTPPETSLLDELDSLFVAALTEDRCVCCVCIRLLSQHDLIIELCLYYLCCIIQ